MLYLNTILFLAVVSAVSMLIMKKPKPARVRSRRRR